MKVPHLLAVAEPPERFAALFGAVAREGLRVGWLELANGAPVPPDELPGPLATAAGQGALRAVSVGEGRTVAVKPLTGPPVLRDLLREHFLGCHLVLVRTADAGEAGLRDPLELPGLRVDGETLVLEGEGGTATRRFTAAELAARLRRPRPW